MCVFLTFVGALVIAVVNSESQTYGSNFNIVVNSSLGVDPAFLADLISKKSAVKSFILDYGLRTHANGSFSSSPQPNWSVRPIESRKRRSPDNLTQLTQGGIDEGYRLTITKEFVHNATGPHGNEVINVFANYITFVSMTLRPAFIELYLGELGKYELEHFPNFTSVKFYDRSDTVGKQTEGEEIIKGKLSGRLQISIPTRLASSLPTFFYRYGGYKSCAETTGNTASAINFLNFEDANPPALGDETVKFLSTCNKNYQSIAVSNDIPRGNENLCYFKDADKLQALTTTIVSLDRKTYKLHGGIREMALSLPTCDETSNE